MKNSTEDTPFSYLVKVGHVSANPVDVHLEADKKELQALAETWDVISVDDFRADLQIARWKKDGIRVRGRVQASIVQACVVTLDPVPSKIDETFEQIFVPENSKLARRPANDTGEMVLDPDGPDVPESFVGDTMDDKPSQALRYGRYKSSMWRAIDATKTGEADVTISAGNTGALMAMSKFCLKSMPQVDRPGDRLPLADHARREHRARCRRHDRRRCPPLVDLAVMGAAMARVVFDLDRPTVGLLNVGVEEIKGVEAVKEAGRILREATCRI
jgi:hypothetical protein